ncbi:MAG: hypothetical protein ACFB12_23185 [Leptolyngbyaceae cyanobacterium]
MGAIAFLILVLIGSLLVTVGGITGVVDAFRVSSVWGLLTLLAFVLFFPAMLVYWVKFWNRKWAKNSLFMVLAGLASTLLALPFLGGWLAQQGFQATEDLDDLTIQEVPVDPNAELDGATDGAAEVVPAEGEGELFQEAILPGLPTAAEIARAELLPSTDPNERVKEIDQERSDPYAYVPIAPPARPTPPAPDDANGGNASPPGQPNGSQPGANQPGGLAGPAPNEPLPDLPPPTITASQVEISGVASVDGQTYAIVKAPNEPTSRYVRVGDRLSNGVVLVKRIENRPGSAPLVVLEERGEEIALPVGANVGSSEESAAALPAQAAGVAALPFLP